MSERVAGVSVPDTTLVADTTAYIRDVHDDLLYHHSRRVFFFGALHGPRRNLEPDLELLYVGAMFHDVGLLPAHRGDQLRFEVDSANEAGAFLRSRSLSEDDIKTVWLAVALHTTPGIPEFLEPVVALVSAGVETDVMGVGRFDLTAQQLDEVTTAHPRPDFKRQILAAFTAGMEHKPDTTFGTVNADVLSHFAPGFCRTDFVDVIRRSSWPE